MALEKHYSLQEISATVGGSIEFWRTHSAEIPGARRIGRRILIPEKALKRYLEDCEIPQRTVVGRRR